MGQAAGGTLLFWYLPRQWRKAANYSAPGEGLYDQVIEGKKEAKRAALKKRKKMCKCGYIERRQGAANCRTDRELAETAYSSFNSQWVLHCEQQLKPGVTWVDINVNKLLVAHLLKAAYIYISWQIKCNKQKINFKIEGVQVRLTIHSNILSFCFKKIAEK